MYFAHHWKEGRKKGRQKGRKEGRKDNYATLSLLLKFVRGLCLHAHLFWHIIFYPIHSHDYYNVIAISREYADVTSKSLLQVLVLLAAWKTKLLFKFWKENIQQRKRAKCTSLKSCHSFQFIAICNSAIIMNINTAQLISYLHYRYTLFIVIRGFTLWASRTLDWTRTLAFWAVSGFWLTKTHLIGHRVIEINRYASYLLQCTTLQK